MSQKTFFLKQCRSKLNMTDKDNDKKTSIKVEIDCERVKDTLAREKNSEVPPFPSLLP